MNITGRQRTGNIVGHTRRINHCDELRKVEDVETPKPPKPDKRSVRGWLGSVRAWLSDRLTNGKDAV